MKKTAKTYRFNDVTISKLRELENLETEKKERGLSCLNSTELAEEAISKYHELVFSKVEDEEDEKRLLKKIREELLINQEALWTVLKLLNRLKFIERPKSDEELKAFISDMGSIYQRFIEKEVSIKIKNQSKNKSK